MGVKFFRKLKGFTLIETIVTLGVLAIALPALFTVLLVVIQQQVKVYRLAQVKKEGDAVIKQVEARVRNEARTIQGCVFDQYGNCTYVPVCNDAGESGNVSTFNNDVVNDNDWFGVVIINADHNVKLIRPAAQGGPVDLTDATKTYVENYNFTCHKKDEFATPTVNLSFDICYRPRPGSDSCFSERPEETAFLRYATTIHLRNASNLVPTIDPNF